MRSESGGGGKCDNQRKGSEVVVYVGRAYEERAHRHTYLSEVEQAAGYKPHPHCGPLPLHLPPFSYTPTYVCTYVCVYVVWCTVCVGSVVWCTYSV